MLESRPAASRRAAFHSGGYDPSERGERSTVAPTTLTLDPSSAFSLLRPEETPSVPCRSRTRTPGIRLFLPPAPCSADTAPRHAPAVHLPSSPSPEPAPQFRVASARLLRAQGAATRRSCLVLPQSRVRPSPSAADPPSSRSAARPAVDTAADCSSRPRPAAYLQSSPGPVCSESPSAHASHRFTEQSAAQSESAACLVQSRSGIRFPSARTSSRYSATPSTRASSNSRGLEYRVRSSHPPCIPSMDCTSSLPRINARLPARS